MNKAYKYRIYPTEEQKILFSKTFGCVRFIYNRMLADKIVHYQKTGETLSATPAQYKQQFPWLKEVDSLALSNAQLNLQAAYKNFFRNKKIGFPKFRSKKSQKNSYTTNMVNNNIQILDGYLKLPKAGFVKIKMHRSIPEDHAIKSVTVRLEPSGKYYASILTEYERDVPKRTLSYDKALGLDYSSPHFYVDSEGTFADMPHYYRRSEERLAREQRKLSHMKKGSGNYQKQRRIIAKIHEKIRNQRGDWLHKESRRLSDEWDIICTEDLNMKNMAQSLALGKATQDNGFGRFRELLQYKLTEQGKKLITIDKWFPSSKTCHHCGTSKTDLTLKDKTWICPGCGRIIDRDHNAAQNIRDEGLSMIAA